MTNLEIINYKGYKVFYWYHKESLDWNSLSGFIDTPRRIVSKEDPVLMKIKRVYSKSIESEFHNELIYEKYMNKFDNITDCKSYIDMITYKY